MVDALDQDVNDICLGDIMNAYYVYKQTRYNSDLCPYVVDALLDTLLLGFKPQNTEEEMAQLVAVLSNITDNLLTKDQYVLFDNDDMLPKLMKSVI